MKTLVTFNQMLTSMGSDVLYHREDGGTVCPCVTPEGFRDPAWHRDNPTAPLCNEQGRLNPVVTEVLTKAAIQSPRMRGNRGAERVNDLLGEIEADDRIGIFPVTWGGVTLNFKAWSDAGEDYILYDGNRYLVVQADKLADVDGDPSHHWECGLRLLDAARPS